MYKKTQTMTSVNNIACSIWNSPGKPELMAIFNTLRHYGIGDEIEDIMNGLIEKRINDYDICETLKRIGDTKVYKKDFRDRGKSRAYELKRLISSCRGKHPHTKYLDIGSNDGIITSAIGIGLRYSTIVGADVKTWIGRENTSHTNTKIKFIGIDLKSTKPIDTEPGFSLITALQTLHHIRADELDLILREVQRLILPRGLFIIREHDCRNVETEGLIHLEHCLYNVLENEADKKTFLKEYYGNYKSLHAWTKLIESYGFKLIYKLEKNNATRYYYAVYKFIKPLG